VKRWRLEEELSERFKKSGLADPSLEARLLLNELEPTASGELMPEMVERARRWVEKRSAGVPLAYLSGRKGFYKGEFFVQPGVLIPRPESEHLIEVAVARASEVHHLADLGCGSGCVGLSLLREMPNAKLFALDASPVAVEVTNRNVAAQGLIGRVQVLHTTVEDWKPMFLLDLVVANPPYIAINDPQVEPSVQRYEPHEALYSGKDGLDAIRSWSQWAQRSLAPGGLWVCEFGLGQAQQVQAIFEQLHFEQIQIQRDLSGKERVISAYKARR
jgi:release factor glutamine methyltransferase